MTDTTQSAGEGAEDLLGEAAKDYAGAETSRISAEVRAADSLARMYGGQSAGAWVSGV